MEAKQLQNDAPVMGSGVQVSNSRVSPEDRA